MHGHYSSPISGDKTTVTFTKIGSVSSITKEIGIAPDGGLTKKAQSKLFSGVAEAVTLRGTPSEMLHSLQGHLDQFTVNNALICAPPPPAQTRWPLTTLGELHRQPEAISRTKKFFPPPVGKALLCLDFDIADMPDSFLAKLDGIGLFGALGSVFPPMQNAARLTRPSVSSGVLLDGKPATGSTRPTGQHRYFIAADGSQAEQFVTNLADRLMLEGFIYGKVTETGAVLPRTLFDVTASSDSSRLSYEASAIFRDKRLSYAPDLRQSEVKGSELLDTSLIKPLSEDERRRLDDVIAALEVVHADEAAEKREQWSRKRESELIAQGVSPDVARKRVRNIRELHELSGDADIRLDDGSIVTAREILADPRGFHGQTCADPAEWDYNGGQNIAIIYSNSARPRIESQAHGRITYLLTLAVEDFFSPLADDLIANEAIEPAIAAGWGEPVDLFGHAEPKHLNEPPAGSLPPVIERWARSEARRKGAPMSFTAIAAVTTVAAAIGNSIRIRPQLHDDTWLEPACIWSVLVAAPGSRKSPVVNAAVAPLAAVDREFLRVDRNALAAWEERSKRRGKDAPNPGNRPPVRRRVVDDTTIEAQIAIHADNPRGLLRAPDEITAMLGSLGAYKKNSDGDRGQFLGMFDGKTISVDRVGRGTVSADKALMSVIGGTQPDKIRGMVRDLGGDGMLQRFLFVVLEDRPERPIDEPADAAALQNYDALVQGIARDHSESANVVRFSELAYAAKVEFEDWKETLSYLPGVSGAWSGHLEKWGKIFPRLVLIFHVIETWSVLEAAHGFSEVQERTVRQAAAFARFLIRHSVRFYELYFDQSSEADTARWLAGHILTKPDKHTFTRRDISDARKELRNDRHALLHATRSLEQASWIATLDSDADGAKSWKVNPLVHERFAARADWERKDREVKREKIREAAKARRELDTVSVGSEK